MALKYIVTKGVNPMNRELPVYQGRFKQTDHIDSVDMAEAISDSCSATASDICAVMESLLSVLSSEMLASHIVRLGEFGSFKLSISSELAATEEAFKKEMIRGVKIVFTPGEQLKTAFAGATYARMPGNE